MKLGGGFELGGDAADRGESYLPVVDGYVLPDDPGRLFAEGKVQNVALIAGTNADEGTLLGGPPVKNIADLHKWAAKQLVPRPRLCWRFTRLRATAKLTLRLRRW